MRNKTAQKTKVVHLPRELHKFVAKIAIDKDETLQGFMTGLVCDALTRDGLLATAEAAQLVSAN